MKKYNLFEEKKGAKLGAALKLVEAALALVRKSKYSISLIYGAHNAVTGKTETPESCASCLKERADYLTKWVEANRDAIAEANSPTPEVVAPVEAPKVEPVQSPLPAAEEPTPNNDVPVETPAEILELEDGTKVIFDQSEEKDGKRKGTVTTEKGKTLKPGKYTLNEGYTLSVQVGGKATITFEDLS